VDRFGHVFSRNLVVLAAVLVLAPPAAAAATGVQPQRGDAVSGSIAFPRPQRMSLRVDSRARLVAALGFDGRCSGGGIGELWMSFVPARGTLAVKDGVFSGRLTGTSKRLGGVAGRSAAFTWIVSGRFTDHEVATATVDGSAEVRSGAHVLSRCTIAKRASVRLTHAG
jgi:opacity protein-like surface antigen